MSNILTPYVAPWVTQWNRYSVQVLTPQAINTQNKTLVSPSGQWWRMLYFLVNWETAATVGNRLGHFIITNLDTSAPVWDSFAPDVQAAVVNGRYIVAANASPFASPQVDGNLFFTWGMPDLLWPPNTEFRFNATKLVGDVFGSDSAAGVEIYTEQRDDSTGDTVLVPTPLLS